MFFIRNKNCKERTQQGDTHTRTYIYIYIYNLCGLGSCGERKGNKRTGVCVGYIGLGIDKSYTYRTKNNKKEEKTEVYLFEYLEGGGRG